MTDDRATVVALLTAPVVPAVDNSASILGCANLSVTSTWLHFPRTMKTIEEVYQCCAQTGAWYGIEITNFAQRNFMKDTVLHTVCSWGDLESVKVLIAAGADVNAKGDQGATPLFNAVIGRNPEVVSFLLASHADPNIANDYKRNVLDYAKNVASPASIVSILEKAKSLKTVKGPN